LKVTVPFKLPELIASYRDDLKIEIERMPACQLLRLKVCGFNASEALVELPVRTEITVDGAIVQGGIVGTLADFAAVSAATASKPVGWVSVTTSFDVHNLAPAVGDQLVAIGRVIKTSTSSGIAAADVYAEKDASFLLVATALVTCRFMQTKSA
jgi:uncharacterized protein (TIGR00369 family)